MVQLKLELLGGFVARFGDGRTCQLPTRKAEALLAYLARPTGRFHSREKLAALLWGETSEAQARQSLRQALASLRRATGRVDGGGDDAELLLTRGDTPALKDR